MLNEGLFDSPKDAEIARLRLTIERFREYDRRRTAYYAERMRRLGELESFVSELEDCGDESSVRARIARLEAEFRKLRKHVHLHGIETRRTEAELDEAITSDGLRRKCKKLGREVERLRRENGELIMRLNCGERATGEGHDEGSSDL